MTPKQMYDEYRGYLDLDPDSWVSGDEVWHKLYNAQSEIVRTINRLNTSYYIQSHTLNIVSGTALYDMPLNARGGRIIFTEDVDDYWEVAPADMVQKLSFDAPGLISLVRDTHFTWQRNKLRIMPTPTAADTFKAWYLPTFGSMAQGFATGGGSQTLTLFSGDPNYTTDYGIIDPRDDFYNNMEVLIWSGTNIGEYYEITDYTGGSTRQISIADNSWGSTPATDSEFCIMCPVIDSFHQLVVVRAAMDGAIKNKDRLRDLTNIRKEMEEDLIAWAQERQVADFDHTEMDDGDF